MSGLEQIAGPEVEPLGLGEVKDSMKIEHEEEDALLERLVAAARQRCEQFTGRVMTAQTWRLTLDDWPGRVVALPLAPLLAVEAVRVFNAGGQAVVVPPELYVVDGGMAPGRLVRKAATWPAPGRRHNGIEIDFRVGYGPSGEDVPAALRQGMLMLIGALYEAREGMTAALPPAVHGFWSSYRMVRL